MASNEKSGVHSLIYALDSRVFAHLFPIIFVFVSCAIALPQLLVHMIFHPLSYFPITTDSIFFARRRFFFYFWRILGPTLNAGDIPVRRPLLEKCHGTVLEIGPGVGDNISLYRRDKVNRLILVEPNTNMHPALRKHANEAGFFDSDGSLLILGCGGAASDATPLELAGVGPDSVDCVALIHVMCGVPIPKTAIEFYRRLLKPGGTMVFYEHVRSDDSRTANWQTWYTSNVWSKLFDGCELDRPTGDWIIRGPNGDFGVGLGGGAHLRKGLANGESGLVSNRWKEFNIVAPDGQPKYTLLPHVKGWAVKA